MPRAGRNGSRRDVPNKERSSDDAPCAQPGCLPPDRLAPSKSPCEAFRRLILPQIAQGHSANRIYLYLRSHGFTGSYASVSRYVRRYRQITSSSSSAPNCTPDPDDNNAAAHIAPCRQHWTAGGQCPGWTDSIICAGARR